MHTVCWYEGEVRAQAYPVTHTRVNGNCTVVYLLVQVCENYGWRDICDADFTDNDAKVICRQLSYSDIGGFSILRVYSTNILQHIYS